MKLYTAKTPGLVKSIFSNLVWEFSALEKKIYLTFDDGPIPEVTEWVLTQLETYNAKATFFCIGDNVKKHPAIYNQIIAKGHAIGNHTYNHFNAWKVSNTKYIDNIIKAQKTLNQELLPQHEKHKGSCTLFRPPYGKITPKLAQTIKDLGYTIIMWDVLSGDFDTSLAVEKCYKNVVKNTDAGSIIVFHDSIKAYDRLRYTLPKVLKHFNDLGYEFEKISV